MLVICPSALLPLTLLPDVWTKTNRAGAKCWEGTRRRHTEEQYIWSSLQSFHLLPQQYALCHRVPVPSAPLAPDMARLALSVLIILCFSLPQLSTGRPSRTRKAVSPRQPGGISTIFIFYFFLISLLFIWPVFLSFSCLHLDASSEDDDVTSQLERLWQEVNSLKEMQALQTGTK